MDPKMLTNNKFGKTWSMIIYSFFLYFFWAGIGTDGLNLYPGVFAGMHGWDYNLLLGYATPAGLISVVASIALGRMILKTGARKMSGITLILSGIIYVVFGFAATPVMYFICLILFSAVSMGFGMIANNMLIANWFPRKKGIALGWSTMGAPFCTAVFVAAMSFMIGKWGIQVACMVIGIIIAIFGIFSLVWVRNYPEDKGCAPDNIAEGQEELAKQLKEAANYKSPFTIGKLLKDKDMWFISVGFGLLWLVLVGIVSQFIPRMISVGYSQPVALTMMTIAAIFGIAGSYFWGWLDQKIGTKKATVIFGIFYIVALLLLIFVQQGPLTYVAIACVGIGIGGLLNLLASMTISVYGRYDFAAANSLISPIATLIMKFAFVIMAALLASSGGSYTKPYVVFIVLDVIGVVLLMLVTDKCKGKDLAV